MGFAGTLAVAKSAVNYKISHFDTFYTKMLQTQEELEGCFARPLQTSKPLIPVIDGYQVLRHET